MPRSLPRVFLHLTLALASAACGSEPEPAGPSGGAASGASSRGGATSGGVAGSSSSAGGGTTAFGGGAGAPTHSGGVAGATYVEPVENVDLNELPTDVPTIRLDVDTAALETLEQNPFTAEDVSGTFTDASGAVYANIQVNYRGAYQLQNLIRSRGEQRNWKLKFGKEQAYRARREWNFNYEPQIRQKLAYDLMRFAGVKVPQPRHVSLVVNGRAQGLYLEYEDPDNKSFLQDKFGDDSGDLYKASTDLPGQTPYFGTTEYLGAADSAYLNHYQKKTNNDLRPEDYSALRAFLQGLNSTSESDLGAWLAQNFDSERFIRYLVVVNFISGWDGLPQRPKNYWLYQVPAAQRWVFLPWDLDATFQIRTTRLNPMGTGASVFYQLDAYEPYQQSENEGQERPLVRRMLKIPSFRAAYVATYRSALTTYLNKGFLRSRIEALGALLESRASAEDRELLQEARTEMLQFVDARYERVSAQLATQ